jgi:predicted AlkP superfamily phosphohydrolase/phosphomutase
VDVNGLLCRAGLQRRLSYGTRFRYRFHRLADRLSRWQARRSRDGHSRRTPRSIEGSVGCDWSRTVAFAPFGQLSGCVFLNRELVRSESDIDRVAGEVCEHFRQASHPRTGERLFADVFRVAERYGLDPQREGLPDVLALSADGFQAQAKWSAFSRNWIEPDPGLPGTHYQDGILSIFAPEVQPGDRLSADLHDVAPTALAMLGLPVPPTMEGRILTEAFETPWAGPTISPRPRRAAVTTTPLP